MRRAYRRSSRSRRTSISGAFTGRPPAPLPRTQTLVFVGMLERSKGVETLADAWRYVAGRVPEARLVVVGRGALRDVVDRLRDDYPGRVEHVEELPPQGVAERMDDATCLVLPSRSEGLGRVILEAFARGRGVVGTRVGGIPDLVEDDVNGLLVENGDVAGLADALDADPDRGRARCAARRGRVRGLADVRVVARRLRDARALAGRPDAGRGAPLMRLVFVTQSVDAEDPILGATVAKLRALAQRCDELVVITDHVGAHDLPPNCTLRTFGSRTKLGRGLRYMQALVPQLLRRDRPDAVIAHMCPIYLVLAAPVAKVVRVPLALWYTHWTIDRTLKLATRLADVGLSVDRRSYPIADPKVLGIGHGIDVSQFGAREGAPAGNGTLRLLALGRTSPSKAFPTLVRACALARAQGVDLQVAIHGASSTDEERRHRGELEALVESEGLAGTVELGEPVPRPAVPELVRRFDAVVNTTRGQTSGGALDKVVYESAACAVPVFACNPYFDEFLSGLPVELHFGSDDAEDLARVLRSFAASDTSSRDTAGRELRRRVETGHSVDSWADAVVATVRRLHD